MCLGLVLYIDLGFCCLVSDQHLCVRVWIRIFVMVWFMVLAHVEVLFYGLVVSILFRVFVSSLGSGVEGTCTAWVCNGVMDLC